ncbi:MAG: winged helix-turn-helix transcriptional regulator [Bacteroidetes bacterium]|nr:winged helix-turn-helix transcriptional regulator [Bacteroidota bacterium]
MPNISSYKSWTLREQADLFKSLAHPSRIGIIKLLLSSERGKMAVKEIYEKMRLEQSIASRHLGIMKNVGFLHKETKGKNSYYSLRMEHPVIKCIAQCMERKS